jgi:hypothetical protein
MSFLVSQQYPELLHYTNFAGLRGILSSGCLWATDASFLNDSSEISHFFDERLRELIVEDARQCAMELARAPQYLARMINDGGIDRLVDVEADAWHSRISRATVAMNRPFVLSLSGPSDERVQHSGLLSQWRGYGADGGDGGYALVFDSQKLEAMLTAEAKAHHYMHVQIGDVYYHGIDPNIQPAAPDVAEYEAIVHQGVRRMMRGGTAEETDRLYEAVTALSCIYKHWGFWEEREIRVVVVPVCNEVAVAGEPQASPQKEIQFRGEMKIPYVELFSAGRLMDAKATLPIKRVIVGPHKNREVHAESVRQELLRAGYPAEVIQSKIPYIGR